MVEKCHLSGDYFGAYLHQNYVEFFSNIEDLVTASEYLSDADYLTMDWAVRWIKLMKGKALRKHSLHEKTAASVLLKPYVQCIDL